MQKKRPKRRFRDSIEGIIFAIIVALLLKVFVVEAYRIPTGSMENTLLVGDFLLVNKFIYGAKSPQYLPFTDIRIPYFQLPPLELPHRGNVIVFEWPGDQNELRPPNPINYIKRCIGLPGDTVQVIDRVVYVNGKRQPFPEDVKFDDYPVMPKGYPNPQIYPPGADWNVDYYGPIVVPKKGMVIHLSKRDFGEWHIFIEREGNTCSLQDTTVYVDGKPAKTYTVKQNYYFMMGDNRENSFDSRFWGFVPFKNILGQAMIIYWSWNPHIPFYDVFAKIASIRWGRIGMLIH